MQRSEVGDTSVVIVRTISVSYSSVLEEHSSLTRVLTRNILDSSGKTKILSLYSLIPIVDGRRKSGYGGTVPGIAFGWRDRNFGSELSISLPTVRDSAFTR